MLNRIPITFNGHRARKKERMDTTLAKRMIERADQHSLPDDHELRVKAKAFEDGAIGFFSEPQTTDVKTFMGRYARAKICWRDYSGEPLV